MTIPETSTPTPRYHGLDALRGIAMLLGIVLHASLPYIPDVAAYWPADKNSSELIKIIFEFIHIWRMPLFFVLAGFFANLIISRKSWKAWWENRFLRIGLPIVVFFPLMSLLLPWIFQYGKTGELLFFFSLKGQPYHLWFLWHLMIFTILTGIFRLPYLLSTRVLKITSKNRLRFISTSLYKVKLLLASIFFRSRFPIGFIAICLLFNISGWGELILNPLASGIYFIFGYSLYKNSVLLNFMKSYWQYYLGTAIILFALYIILGIFETNMPQDIYNQNAETDIKPSPIQWLQYLLKIICAVLFSYAFIGLAEGKFNSYNSKVRFISNGSYWMYLIHLPIVSFITFAMIEWPMPAIYKFLLAILVTTSICIATYKYLVRSTFISIFLNGKRYPK